MVMRWEERVGGGSEDHALRTGFEEDSFAVEKGNEDDDDQR